MPDTERNCNDRLKLVYAISISAVYLFYLFSYLNIYLFQTLTTTWYAAFLPVLLVGTLYFCGQWEKLEYRFLVLFFFWYVLSRMLCGDPALKVEYLTVIQISVLVPVFALGMTLNAEERRKFLTAFSWIVGSFYFLLGLLCIYTYLLRVQIQNPISGQLICSVNKTKGFARLGVLGINVDTTAFWFMGSFFMMVFQFFMYRKVILRIVIILYAIVDYIVISMIFTRSVMVAVAFAIGLLAVLLLIEKIRIKTRALKVLLLLLAFLLTVPLTYKSFEVVMRGFGRISVSIRYNDSSEEEKQEAFEQDYSHKKQLIGTGKSLDAVSSGRIKIYKASIDVIRENPFILLRGSLDDQSSDDLTRILYEKGLIKEGKRIPHYQNYLIQVLIISGLPGLLMVVAFSLLLIYKAIKTFFYRDKKVPISVKALILPIAASMIYMMFEIGLFTLTDLRTLYFFLMSGMFLGWYYDSFPKGYRRRNNNDNFAF